MMFGGSVSGCFGTLQTLRSPSDICVASMSVFCFEDEPCQASPVIRAGVLFVLSVCTIVKDGCNVAMRMDPFI